jgi:hypothetical protein
MNHFVSKAGTRVVWLPKRPHLTVQMVPGGTRRMCYSETMFEVICDQPITKTLVKALDEAGQLGVGQCLETMSTDTISDDLPPVVVDEKTYAPTGESAHPGFTCIKKTYHRMTLRRICDSSD